MTYSAQEAAALLDKGRGQQDQILIVMREAWGRARRWHRARLNPPEGEMPPALDAGALESAEMHGLSSASSEDAIAWYWGDRPFEQVGFTGDELARWQRAMSGGAGIECQYFSVSDPGEARTDSPTAGMPGDKLGRKGEEWAAEEILAVLEMQARVGTAKTAEHLGCSDSLVRGLKKRARDKGLIATVTPNVTPNVFGGVRSKPPL